MYVCGCAFLCVCMRAIQIISDSIAGRECGHNLYRGLFHDWSDLGVKVSNAPFTVQSELIIGISRDQMKAQSSVVT